MIADTAQVSIQVETGENGEQMALAATIYELYSLGLIAEEIDSKGTPRFRVTGRQL